MTLWLVCVCIIVSIVSYNLGAYLGQKELEDSFELVEKSDERVNGLKEYFELIEGKRGINE